MIGGTKNKVKKLLCTGIVILAIVGCATAPAAIVTSTYEFLPDPNALRTSGGFAGQGQGTFSIEGQFRLSVDFDAGIAMFEQVDATLSGEVWFYDDSAGDTIPTDSLGVLFHMTELESTYVSDTAIAFVFERNIPRFPIADIHLSVTFLGDSVQLVGDFSDPVWDGYDFYLNAVAVPEPMTITLLILGALLLRSRRTCLR